MHRIVLTDVMKNSVLLTLAASSLLLLTAICVEANKDPCASYVCEEGTKCMLENVQCIKDPCPPIPYCAPVNNNGGASRSKREVQQGTPGVDHYPTLDPCSIVRCAGKCVVVQDCSEGPCRPRAKCVPNTEGT